MIPDTTLDLSPTVNVVVQVARKGNVTGLSTLDVYAAVVAGYVTWERRLGRYRTTLPGKQLLQRLEAVNQSRVVV